MSRLLSGLHFLLSSSIFLALYIFTFSPSCILRVYFFLSPLCFSFFQHNPCYTTFLLFPSCYVLPPFCLKVTLHSLHSRLRKRDAFFVTQFPSENQFSLSKRLTRAFFFSFPLYPLLPLSHLPPPLRDTPPVKRAFTDEWNIFCYSLYMRRMLTSPYSISFYRAKKSIAFLLLSFILFYSLLYSPWSFRSSTFALSYRRDLHGMTFPSARTRYKRVFWYVIIMQRLIKKKKKNCHQEVELS